MVTGLRIIDKQNTTKIEIQSTHPYTYTPYPRLSFKTTMIKNFHLFPLTLTLLLTSLTLQAAKDKPNFIIIFTDDQGYGDLSCFGSTKIKTPNIDRMAKEGRRFTNFMVASPVCTPSRAALLTGCYPKRVGMHQHVLFPSSTKGLNPTEHTIADHLKSQGYATAAFGKWHLGHHPETLPQKNGFDTYFGIPYSNDMVNNGFTGQVYRKNILDPYFQAPATKFNVCLLYTSPSPRDGLLSRMPSSA